MSALVMGLSVVCSLRAEGALCEVLVDGGMLRARAVGQGGLQFVDDVCGNGGRKVDTYHCCVFAFFKNYKRAVCLCGEPVSCRQKGGVSGMRLWC